MSFEFPLYEWRTLSDTQNTLFFFWYEDRELLENQPQLNALFSLFSRNDKLEIGRNSYNAGVYQLPYSQREILQKPYLLGKLRQFVQQKISQANASQALLYWREENEPLHQQVCRQFIISYLNLAYRPKNLGFKTDETSSQIGVILENIEQNPELLQSYEELKNIAQAMLTAREISDLPSDIATPEYIVKKLKNYAQKHHLNIHILDMEGLQQSGLNILYTVGKSGLNSPYLIQIDYQGNPNSKDVYSFVGKGITFDTGGLWLKSGDGMKTMKYDMCGAGLLVGLLQAVVENTLPVNLRIILGLAENMINEKSMRPGEIVKSYSGKTIEIINTDAEGRLILADLLAFAAEQKPRAIIDVATLTGAVVKALGYDISGMMTNSDQLEQQLNLAAVQTQDAIWRLPCDERFLPQVESHIADYCNTPPNNAAICVSAGFFLSRFVNDCPWAHLDISGTTLYRDQGTYASGKPLYLLYQFLKNTEHH